MGPILGNTIKHHNDPKPALLSGAASPISAFATRIFRQSRSDLIETIHSFTAYRWLVILSA